MHVRPCQRRLCSMTDMRDTVTCSQAVLAHPAAGGCTQALCPSSPHRMRALRAVTEDMNSIDRVFTDVAAGAVSAGLMRVQIAALSGWVSVHLLFAIFGLTAVTMLFGWLMETVNGERVETYTSNHLTVDSVRAPSIQPISTTCSDLTCCLCPAEHRARMRWRNGTCCRGKGTMLNVRHSDTCPASMMSHVAVASSLLPTNSSFRAQILDHALST
jgi:Heliorhodopsin